ncbi:MAG: DUF6683 family protein [Pyrinomonadaceae bacterium]
MNSKSVKLLALIVLLLVTNVRVVPQTHGGGGKANIKEGLGSTWKGPSSTLITRLLKKKTPVATTATGRRTTTREAPVTAKIPTASVTFRLGANSGVDQALASAFASTPAEKHALLLIFQQVKQAYETEVAKEGKSNNLAAAMTFFIASNVVAYHRTPMPEDDVTEQIFVSLRDIMVSTPEVAKMTNAEKHQMHDWLVYMGGFILLSYADATQKNDRQALDNARLLAGYSMQIALGVDVSTLTITNEGLTTSGAMASTRIPKSYLFSQRELAWQL